MHSTSQNPFVIPAGITSKVEKIMAGARSRFGHDAFRMEDAGDGAGASDGGTGDQGATGGTDDATGAGAGADDKGSADDGADDKAGATDEPWADPAKAEAEIKRLRRENGADRTAAKTKAAEAAKAELAQTIGKALGLVKDDAKLDPAELTQQLTTSQTEARQAKVELAVFKTAGKHQGDPDALLDSRGFLAKLADLDPADAKFQDKVDAAIKAAVTDNPKLKASQAAGSSSADHAGGSGNGGAPRKPKSMADAVASTLGT